MQRSVYVQSHIESAYLTRVQKKRKYGRDQPEEEEKKPDEDDLLKDATTLYVGNLLVSIYS